MTLYVFPVNIFKENLLPYLWIKEDCRKKERGGKKRIKKNIIAAKCFQTNVTEMAVKKKKKKNTASLDSNISTEHFHC